MSENITVTDGDGNTINQTGPVTVYQAWASVMRQVQGLSKSQRHDSPGAKFMFRGIDAVMNAVGPALRDNGVAVIPDVIEVGHRDVQTSGGKASRETTVRVQYMIIGPAGDSMMGSAPGEAMDNGDKGTSKAMSVAFRTFLLQALCLPTDEPDPDEEAHQRVQGPTDQERAQDTAGRAAKTTDVETLQKVRDWVKAQGLGALNVNVVLGGKQVTGSLDGYLGKRIEEVTPADQAADIDAAAEKALADSLGATEIDPDAGPGENFDKSEAH